MSVDLVAFLRERLYEDEQLARAAYPGPWTRDYHAAFMHGIKDRDGRSLMTSGLMESANVRHIVRNDPARVLAEVDAKRRIVDASAVACPESCRTEHSFDGSCDLRWMGPAWNADGQRWVRDADGAQVPAPPAVAEWMLRLLTLPYREHPDYRPEWDPTKPSGQR